MDAIQYDGEKFQKPAFRVQTNPASRNKRPRSPLSNRRQSLEMLAAEADAALCLVRSMEKAREELPKLCEQALDAHERFRSAMDDLKMSKISTLSSREKQDCGSSYLLSTVATSWLYLRLDKVNISYHNLLNGMKWTASLLQVHGQERNSTEFMAIHEIVSIVRKELPIRSHAVLTAIHVWNALNLARQRQFDVSQNDEMTEYEIKEEHEVNDLVACDDSSSCKMLALARYSYVVKALQCHLLFDRDHLNSGILREQRDGLLMRAASDEPPASGFCSARMLGQRTLLTLQALEKLWNTEHCNIDDELLADALCSTLGSPSAFAPAYNLLGCLRMRYHNNSSLALRHFENALMGSGLASPARREVLSNTAECFLQLGDPSRALCLLMQLIKRDSLEHPIPYPSTLVLLSKRSCFQWNENEDINWRLYQTATLDNSNTTALAASEEMYTRQVAYSDVAYAFSLLQTDRPSNAMQVCVRKINCGLKSVAFAMYKAESLLLQTRIEHRTSDRLMPSSRQANVSTIKSLAESALRSYLQLNLDMHEPERRTVDAEIKCILYNNTGVINVMEGDYEAALKSFRRACSIISCIATAKCMRFLQPFFNLSCLLWRQHRAFEAVNEWLPRRGVCLVENGFNINAVGAALSEILSLFLKSSNLPVNDRHIPKWNSHGMDLNMVAIIDMITLQCGIELASTSMVAESIEGILPK